MGRRLLVLVFVLAVICSAARAQVPAFEKGDRVCFLGDSIFHGGKVHSDLLLFYATRHPDAPISVYNRGIAGDMAKEAIRRLDWEVKPLSPTVTVVMFGMNDVGRWLYGDGKDAPGNLQQRNVMMDAHVQNMDRIISELKVMGSKTILCTPTPYDQTTQRKTENAKGVDDALAAVAANARKVASEGGHGLVDFHAQMNRVLHEQQAKDPQFTMMDGARIHPDDAGHLLMAYIFLKAQGASPTVSRIVIDAKGGLAESANCAVSKIEKTPSGLAFEVLAKSIPFPVEGKETAVLAWVPFMEDLNQEMLLVKGLAAGDYEVLIDSEAVGAESADDLDKGINLAGNAETPQYKQAVRAMELNEERRARENATLRVFAALEHDVLRPRGVDTSDMNAVRAVMDKAIEEEGKNKTWRFSYFTNLSKAYYAEKPKQKEIEKELADMTAKVFEMARPQTHRYEIRAKAREAVK